MATKHKPQIGGGHNKRIYLSGLFHKYSVGYIMNIV